MKPQRKAQPGAVPLRVFFSRKPRCLIVAGHVFDNWRHARRRRHGDVQALLGSTHKGWPLAKSLAYIQRVFDDYLAYAGLDEQALQGKRLLELGPGDNLGVALKFLAAGVSRVVCLDKVLSVRDSRQEWEIYRALRETCTPSQRVRYDAAINLDNGIVPNPGKLQYIYGVGVEDSETLLAPASFDWIVSRAVLMEIPRIGGALKAMDRLLGPGGGMIHKIAPLQDYGIFTQNGYHPLEYLTLPHWLYARMTDASGKPNRRLIGYYRAALQDLGYSARVHITNVLGNARELPPGTFQLQRDIHYSDETLALVREIRPRLASPFRQAPDDELITQAAVVVATKPL